MISTRKLISFDLKAEFGFLKKPDINDGVCLTFNMIHKPALLGLLGAIAGMGGYKKNGEFPEYYKRLRHLKVGIMPLNSDKGNFTKEIVSYNNGTGFASNEAGGNLIVTEQILIEPGYRCFLLLNIENKDEKLLFDSIFSYQAEFIPYLGKNDFSAWWTEAKEYNQVEAFDFSQNYKINSIFTKTEAVSDFVAKSMGRGAGLGEPTFLYFERLPIAFDEELFQYTYGDFVYSNSSFIKDMDMSSTGSFYKIEADTIIQLF